MFAVRLRSPGNKDVCKRRELPFKNLVACCCISLVPTEWSTSTDDKMRIWTKAAIKRMLRLVDLFRMFEGHKVGELNAAKALFEGHKVGEAQS
jgi:hypothetical protein